MMKVCVTAKRSTNVAESMSTSGDACVEAVEWTCQCIDRAFFGQVMVANSPTTRGCPNGCAFSRAHNGQLHSRASPDRVTGEFTALSAANSPTILRSAYRWDLVDGGIRQDDIENRAAGGSSSRERMDKQKMCVAARSRRGDWPIERFYCVRICALNEPDRSACLSCAVTVT